MNYTDTLHLYRDGGPSDSEGKPVILVCMQNPTDRKLLQKVLSESFEFIDLDEQPDMHDFDACIFDPFTFNQKKKQFARLKEQEAPVLLPYLMLVKEIKWTRIDSREWDIIDDIVPIPAPAELLKTRIKTNLRSRNYSLRLAKQKEQYRLITENSTDMIARNAPDGTYLFVSPAVKELLGYDPEELIGESAYDTIHPGDRGMIEKKHKELLSTAGKIRSTFRKKTKNGTYKWVESVSRTLTDPETGKVVEIQSSVRDVSDRKNYEVKLERERNLFRKLTESSPIGIAMINPDGQITFANSQAEHTLGLSKSEITERTYNDPNWSITDFEGGPFPETELPFYRVKSTGQPVHDVQHAIEWPDGTRKLMSINAAPLKGPGGRLEGVIVSILDVTKQKKREQELQEEREFIRSAVNNMPGIFFLLDDELNFVFWNENLENDLGYDKEEISGMHPLEFFKPEDTEYVQEKIEEIYAKGSSEVEIDIITKSAKPVRYFLIGAKLMREGKPYIVGSGIDISERVEAESELKKSEQRWENLVNQDPNLIQISIDGVIQYINPAGADIYGVDEPARLEGTPVFDLIDASHAQQVEQRIEKLKKGESMPAVVQKVRARDGRIRYVEFQSLPLDSDRDHTVLTVGRDITEQKEVMGQLHERIKEQRCLYKVSNLSEEIHDVEEILERAVSYLPEGWQYPEITEASIEFDGNTYQTPGFREAERMLTSTKKTVEGKSLTVKVVCLEKDQGTDIPAFLAEEHQLIKTITETLASQIKRIIYEDKLLASEKRWELLVQKNPSLVQLTSTDNIIRFVNPAGAELYGFEDPEKLIGEKWTDHITFGDTDLLRNQLEKLSLDESSSPVTHEVTTRGGEKAYIELQFVPIYHNDEKVMLSVAKDVTENYRYHQELEKSLKEKEVLLQEVHHRVKNNLAVVSGLLQIQRYETENQDVKKILSNSEMRIRSMALIHEKLYQSSSLSKIDLESYVKDLTSSIIDSIGTQDTISLNIESSSIMLNVNQAVPCALILNELITNAIEHAFPGRQKGRIKIKLMQKDETVSVSVRDNGKGIPADFSLNEHRSMGFTIIDTLIKQLSASFNVTADNGTNITFSFKKQTLKGSSNTLIE